MNNPPNDYYVYVYIDPRNFEEFYYGKGRGDRMYNHLNNKGKSEKDKIINEIISEDLEPIIKVIATNLSEYDALLIETTLIWRLGSSLKNINKGFFADKFRPRNTLHKNLNGFDFKNATYVFTIKESEHRCWEDFIKCGFISIGQEANLSQQLGYFKVGDTFVAYLEGKGFLGVGIIEDTAKPINDFKYLNKTLHHYELKSKKIFDNCDNDKSEYLAKVKWLKTVEKDSAVWDNNLRLFKPTQIKASLESQQGTLEFISEKFGIDLVS